ncbi:MAG: sulfatase-like hydrolase/transferase, partial [Myxococcota bacterium]|nr:sulfatase-like hydrolase/transferase [Myxococcota bacterium]
QQNRDRPFALLLSHKSVHADFVPDEPDRGRFAGAPVALPDGAHPWTHLTNAQYTHLGFAPLAESIRRQVEALASLDREIGRVLDFLDANGLARDTFVVYASDNGYLWGEHGQTDKRWAWEESIRIPLLIRHPASVPVPGSAVDRIVANIDIAPTLLDLAGVATPEHMQGRSLLPLLADPRAEHRDALLYSYFFEPPYPTPTLRALVTERYKYVESAGHAPQLFDLALDPREQDDLAGGAAASVERALAARLAELEATH